MRSRVVTQEIGKHLLRRFLCFVDLTLTQKQMGCDPSCPFRTRVQPQEIPGPFGPAQLHERLGA